MKTKIIALLMAVFPYTFFYSQYAFKLADRSIKTELPDQIKMLQLSIADKHQPYRPYLKRIGFLKTEPGVKGLKNYPVRSSRAKIYPRAATYFGIDHTGVFDNVFDQKKQLLFPKADMTYINIAFGLAGAGIDAIINRIRKDTSDNSLICQPKPCRYGPADMGLKYYSTEPDFEILKLSYKF